MTAGMCILRAQVNTLVGNSLMATDEEGFALEPTGARVRAALSRVLLGLSRSARPELTCMRACATRPRGPRLTPPQRRAA